MEKNIAAPMTSNLSVIKTIGIQSTISSIRCISSLDKWLKPNWMLHGIP